MSDTGEVISRFHRGFLVRRNGLLVLHTQGSPYERGLQHGSLLREQVQRCFSEVYRRGFFRVSPLFPAFAWYTFARLNEPYLTGAEKEELHGLADGSGLPYRDVLVMNSGQPIESAHNLMESGRVATGGCTQLVVRGQATRQQALIIGRNLDCVNLNQLNRYVVIQVQHPDNGHGFITPNFAGKVLDAVTGWNDQGFYAAQNIGELARENFHGLYSGALVRRLVQGSATISEALTAIGRLTSLGGGGRIITMADRQGAGVLEIAQTLAEAKLSSKRLSWRSFGDEGDLPDTIVTTNHYRARDLSRALPSESSWARLTRAQALIKKHYGNLDAELVKTILTDKVNATTGLTHDRSHPSNNIIDWFGPRVTKAGPFPVPDDLELRTATTISVVSDLSHGVMWVAQGKSYIDSPTDYRCIDALAELFL